MEKLNFIIICVYTVIFAILLFLFVKEIMNLLSIRKIFTCEHCNKLNDAISNGRKCPYCNKTFKNKKENWEHYLLFSVSEINTSLKKIEFKYEYYKKQSLKELIMCGATTIVMLLAILSKL